MTATRTPLSILCFGDSLTEGYSSYGMCFTPYSSTLLEHLSTVISDQYEITIDTDGVSGESVTAGFLKRMRRQYSPHPSTSSDPYDIIIFLGGTNDLARRVPVPQIHAAIQEITSIPLEHDARVLLLTVPECAAKASWLDDSREELNRHLLSDSRETVCILDLHKLMPYHALTSDQQSELWDDGLHFTPKGYEKIGHLVAEKVIEMLMPAPEKGGISGGREKQ